MDQSGGFGKNTYQGAEVEQLVYMVFKAQEEHPEWSKLQILDHIKQSLERRKPLE